MLRLVTSIVVILMSLFSFQDPNHASEKKLTTKEIEKMSRDALFLLLVPNGDSITKGTGFLISTNPPLLVTCGHVIDKYEPTLPASILQNETGYPARVIKEHIHPKYQEAKENKCPDVAILELELHPKITPVALPLASHTVLQDLLATEIITRGYPIYSVNTKIERLQPETVIQEGIVSRISDFWDVEKRSDMADRPLLELTVRNFGGASGSPIMNKSGHVVGIIHASEVLSIAGRSGQTTRDVANGLHAKFIWELLQQKYPKVAKRLKNELHQPAIAAKVK